MDEMDKEGDVGRDGWGESGGVVKGEEGVDQE